MVHHRLSAAKPEPVRAPRVPRTCPDGRIRVVGHGEAVACPTTGAATRQASIHRS